MARQPPHEPLIAIIGATGTGKSQLAVALAKRFNGEIINGDAMQLYAGLPIITNKITTEEQQGIPHHLLGCIGLHEPTWVVGTYVSKALNVIEEIRSRGRLPILVGGTHYYTQSLLFRDGLAGADGQGREPDDYSEGGREEFSILQQPTDILLAELQKVDPAMAERWHPKDRRKIQRSLEMYLTTGRKASETYAEQQRRRTSCNLASPSTEEGDDAGTTQRGLRTSTLILWVHAENDALRKRLDARVDTMLKAGLLDEVRTLNDYADAESAHRHPMDEARGIWVSIGFKEFKEYVRALQEEVSSEKDLQKLKAEALERTKAATRQYAKRQLRWIRIKLLNALSACHNSTSLYLLDGSDVSTFSVAVVDPAIGLADTFLTAAREMPEPCSISPAAAAELSDNTDASANQPGAEWTKQHCEACDVTCVIEAQWLQHVGSKAHKKRVSKRRQRETMAAASAVAQQGPAAEGGDSDVVDKG
ncbi:tRNA dimethylallyltransferase, mitochondrial [Teratosphaeriaceae sp. CCFEE 6253]|nr:tRNA dimethylallyltransferase, mitochondrial [Teratosphaeriaceae sp. CCFEE 6253]